MIVHPYKKFPARKRIALVTPEGEYVDENGERLDPLRVKKEYRCFIAWESARKLTTDGHGEALMWNGEHIRWRPGQHPTEDRWIPRPSDAYVLRVPMYERAEPNLSELARWRDWLWRYRAQPGTMGGTSMSLLRACIRRPLWTSVKWDKLWIRQSAGGIIRMGPHGPGEYHGVLNHWDLSAAYASEIGTLRYGGRWWDEPNTTDKWLAHLVARGIPVMVRARVRIPDLLYGPLPVRPRRLVDFNPLKRNVVSRSGHGFYPVAKTIQGLWTYEEICAARNVGCRVHVIEAFTHSSAPQSPFAEWWGAIQEGRDMEGLAGMLAKVTGNALWGMFALDPTVRGRRSIHSKPGKNRRMVMRPLPVGGYPIAAIDLAEIVAGRVRARLYEAMTECGDDLVCAHTDGLWSSGGVRPTGEWRAKETARQIQVLSPQHMRWWAPGKARPVTMYAGVPYEQADTKFDEDWASFESQAA